MSADRFTLLVPLKPLAAAKSRLRGAVPGTQHEELVLALAAATLEAAAASPAVARVIVITNENVVGFETLPDPHEDLNAALAEVAHRLSGPLAALPADLPALRTAELTEALVCVRLAASSPTPMAPALFCWPRRRATSIRGSGRVRRRRTNVRARCGCPVIGQRCAGMSIPWLTWKR